MNLKDTMVWAVRIILLTILFIPIWIAGALAVDGFLPDVPSEPGLINETVGMFFISFVSAVLIVSLIVTSRWRGWKLALLLALAYYGSFTLITQVETWFFLSEITVTPELLPRLFIMGLSIPILFFPLAVLICRRWKSKDSGSKNINMVMPIGQLMLKLAIIALAYLVIYWSAGYFIAWQNPELRAFYGSPGEIVPFWEHTVNTIRSSPGLVLLQFVRGLLLALIATPVIRGSNVKPWLTALLVGLLLAVPHLGHIISNPLMPIASVRFSHMIETATSTFLFGLIIVWLLHRRHNGLKDLLGRRG